ncbi:MAG: hypothetical protein M1817_006585 [Caeruleum heppii]|nr:MAG: hypothetical protein M1817_006585 [Caeruleum heppii]
MAHIDPNVASVLDSHHHDAKRVEDEDEDELFSALENDDRVLSTFREQRLQQLHSELSKARQRRNEGYGNYTEITEEKSLMDLTTSIKWVVVHFFKPDFGRCGIMDAHLEVIYLKAEPVPVINVYQALAPVQYDTRFLRINVDNAPFLVTKLKVQVLPCVLAFVNAVAVDRIIGFEGLGHTPDTFTTKDLEARLLRAGVIARAKTTAGHDDPTANATKFTRTEDSDDDDD